MSAFGEPNLGFSAEFRRQDHFRRFSASLACRIEYRRRIRASADFRLQPAPTEFTRRISASEFKLQDRDPLPRVPAYMDNLKGEVLDAR